MSAPTTVECQECGAIFAGGRTEARRARWEPYSTKSQQAMDSGPMVCPGCVMQALDQLVDALKRLR